MPGKVPKKKKHPKLTKEILEEIKATLLLKKQEIEDDVPGLRAEGLGSGSENSKTPLHFADLGTDTFNQNMALGRLEREESLLDFVHNALDKLDTGEFGLCAECAKPLRLGRLKFAPWVPNCIECQEKLEQG